MIFYVEALPHSFNLKFLRPQPKVWAYGLSLYYKLHLFFRPHNQYHRLRNTAILCEKMDIVTHHIDGITTN